MTSSVPKRREENFVDSVRCPWRIVSNEEGKGKESKAEVVEKEKETEW